MMDPIETWHDAPTFERMEAKIKSLEAKLAALVEVGEVRLKHLELLLKKRGLNEPEYSEYDVLKAAIAAAKVNP